MKRFRNILASSKGFTLIEMLVSVSIMVVVTGIFGAALFQVFGIQRYWTDDIKATRTTRHAGSWFAGDALNASAVLDDSDVSLNPTCGSSSSPEVTLVWTRDVANQDADDTYRAVYRVGNVVAGEGVLYRDYTLQNGADDSVDDLGTLTLTTGVVEGSQGFTLCGNLLTAKMNILADRGTTKSLDLSTYLRKLD